MECINDMWWVAISQNCQCTLQVALSSFEVARFKRKLKGELAKSVSIEAERWKLEMVKSMWTSNRQPTFCVISD